MSSLIAAIAVGEIVDARICKFVSTLTPEEFHQLFNRVDAFRALIVEHAVGVRGCEMCASAITASHEFYLNPPDPDIATKILASGKEKFEKFNGIS